ncbi:MAG: hypothetical protein R3D45_07200 [Rhizobiaceae bacterium]
MRRHLIGMGAAAFFLALGGNAHAQHIHFKKDGSGLERLVNYFLSIDCKHSDADNTASKNTLRIQYLDDLGRELEDFHPDFEKNRRLIVIDSCSVDVLGSLFTPWEDNYEGWFGAEVNDDALILRLSIQGADAFLIDQMKLSKRTEENDYPDVEWTRHWGSNNGTGYCLSTDPKDGETDWRDYVDSHGCVPCLDFYLEKDSVGSVVECQPVGIWHNPQQGVCRDANGNYPSWDGELSTVDAICAQTCYQNADCEAYAWDPTRNYCQYFGKGFSKPSNVDKAGPIIKGDMSQPNFECRIKG